MTDSPGETFVQFTWQNSVARRGWLWRRRQLRRLFRAFRFCRRERSHKGFFEIVNVLEIFNRILLRLSEHSGRDEIEDHMSDILARTDAPAVEDRHDHRAKLLKRVLPDTIEQFRPGHVSHAYSFDFFLLLRGEIERIPQKDVPVPLITGVVGHKRFQSLGKSNFLHLQKTRVSGALPKIIGNRKRATVTPGRKSSLIFDLILQRVDVNRERIMPPRSGDL